jgi:general secretion pathway protein K
MRGDRGSVLVSVLWIILVLSVVSFSLASSVRLEVTSTQQSFDSERAFFMAKGAAEIVFDAFSKDIPLPDDSPIRQQNGEYVFPFASGEARVHFESKVGLINLNEASDKTLASLFDSLGADRETRNRLVDSILDWRDSDDIPHLYGAEVGDYENAPGRPAQPRNGPFVSVDELLLVKNMTPDIFFGSFTVDSVTGQYQRIPGVRDLVAVRPGEDTVDPNVASYDVLKAIPGVSPASAEQIVTERTTRRFSSSEDLANRIPQLSPLETMQHFTFGDNPASELVSRGTIHSSGVSRTVRLLFKREEKLKIITYAPLLYKRTDEPVVDRWRLE